MNECRKNHKEGSCEEEEYEKYASAGDKNGLKKWAVKEEAETDGGKKRTNKTDLPCARAESERGEIDKPCEVKRSGKERKEEEEERREKKKVVKEGEMEGDELEEEKSYAKKKEEKGFEEVEAIHGEGYDGVGVGVILIQG